MAIPAVSALEGRMSERLHRAQVLLEPKQHKALAAIAQRRGTSISQVVREIVGQYVAEQESEQEQHQAALEKIRELRERILARRGGQPLDVDVPALIEEIRDERDQEIWNAIFGDRGGCQPDHPDPAARR